MSEVPLGLAFAAGLVATVNPCGFAMLPAYLSYFLGLAGGEADEARPDATVARALAVGGVVSLGFLAVFGVAGVLLSAGLRFVVDAIPWIALGVGVGLIVLAVAMLAGYQPTVGLPKAAGGTGSRRFRSVFVFGISYALASLSCTLPVFLTVVVGSMTGVSLASSVAVFVAFAMGMAMVLLVLTVALALARHAVLGRLRWVMRNANRISGALILVAGAYITGFWAFNLGEDPSEASALTTAVEQVSQRATTLAGEHRLAVGLALGGVLVAIAGWLLLRAPEDRSGSGTGEPGAGAPTGGEAAADGSAGDEPGVDEPPGGKVTSEAPTASEATAPRR